MNNGELMEVQLLRRMDMPTSSPLVVAGFVLACLLPLILWGSVGAVAGAGFAGIVLWSFLRPSGTLSLEMDLVNVRGGDYWGSFNVDEIATIRRQRVFIPKWIETFLPAQAQVFHSLNPGLEVLFTRRKWMICLSVLPHPWVRKGIVLFMQDEDERRFCVEVSRMLSSRAKVIPIALEGDDQC